MPGFFLSGRSLTRAQHIDSSRYMDNMAAVESLSALAQPTRLEVFRLLASKGDEGIAAGQLAEALNVPQNTLSSHLATLARAGLVNGERQSRSIIYRADLAAFRELMLFMLSDCCNGRPEVCAPILSQLTATCRPGGDCR